MDRSRASASEESRDREAKLSVCCILHHKACDLAIPLLFSSFAPYAATVLQATASLSRNGALGIALELL